jgi:hypothetical protein
VIVNTSNVTKGTKKMSQSNISSLKEAADALQKAIDVELSRIRIALADRNLSKVATSTGLHENTVRNIAKGRGGIPLLATIDKLSQYLFAQNA